MFTITCLKDRHSLKAICRRFEMAFTLASHFHAWFSSEVAKCVFSYMIRIPILGKGVILKPTWNRKKTALASILPSHIPLTINRPILLLHRSHSRLSTFNPLFTIAAA